MERSLAARIARPPFALPSLRRPRVSQLWRGRRTRIALLAVAIALPVLGGGYLLLRNSSLVAVERVQVSGVRGAEAPAIEAALVAAAKHMSTLDVRTGALQAAVAPFRVVSSVRAVASFPHGLRIEVGEQLPVAALLVNGQRTAVAADGVVLGPALLSSSLPTLTGYLEPAAGGRLHSVFLLESLAVLGVAPRPLAGRVARVYTGPEGLTVAMRNGLLAYFGDATRPHAKWLSLARVLADHSSAGASYVDVRLPGRPAAGFPAGTGPPSSATSEEAASAEAGTSGESAVGALAAGLSKEGGVSGTGPASPTSGAAGEPSAASTPSESSTGASEPGAGEAGEAAPGAGSEATRETPAAGG